LIEAVPGVKMLEKTWGSNVYFLDGEKPSMVDAGFPLDRKRIIRALGYDGPACIIATHYHLDHVGSIHALKSHFGSTVAAHAADAPVMEGTEPYERYKLGALRTVYYRMFAPFYPYEHVGVDVVLEDGDVLDVFGGLEVIHLPGHTDGSIALYQRDQGILFSGDTIRNEGGVLEGPPPQFSTGVDTAFNSIRDRLLGLEFEVILPGHGEPVTRNANARLKEMLRGRKRL
jgi:glyoxylase-like metal-dependent hydrolase (beta-lactamase superfamily II)